MRSLVLVIAHGSNIAQFVFRITGSHLINTGIRTGLCVFMSAAALLTITHATIISPLRD